MEVYLYTLASVCLFTTVYILFGDVKKTFPSFSSVLTLFLSLFIIYLIASSPIFIYEDKWMYENFFDTISLESALATKDTGFGYYTFFSRKLYSNSSFYFLQTASLYILGYVIFGYKALSPKYVFLFLLVSYASFGFKAYGENTLRAGLALSMLLIAISLRRKLYLFILFSFLAVLFHKSMAIPLLFFLITGFYNRPKLFFYVWFIALIISAVGIGGVTEFLKENIFSFDDRPADYFDPKEEARYRSGFRLDFVIYSFLPILISSYYIFKLKLKDVLYSRLFGTYILTNATWLLVIRMAFTDRVAYLSWFLIPFLLLFPLLRYKLPLNQRLWAALIIIGTISFTFAMS